MFNWFRDEIQEREIPDHQKYIKNKNYPSAILSARDEFSRIRNSDAEKYFSPSWGVFVNKDEKGHFYDPHSLPYRIGTIDFEGSFIQIEFFGDKFVWLSHSDSEMTEIYIYFYYNADKEHPEYASISRSDKTRPARDIKNCFLVDFALGIFSEETRDWEISEDYNESSQSFWTSTIRRNPEIRLLFRDQGAINNLYY